MSIARHPNDYEAQVYQGKINSHAAENLGVTDKGIVGMRRNLRKEIRAVRDGGDPSALTRVDDEWMTHAQDTVLPIAPMPGKDDKELMQEVTDAVMAVVFAGDQYAGQERIDYIRSELQKIKSQPQFCNVSG